MDISVCNPHYQTIAVCIMVEKGRITGALSCQLSWKRETFATDLRRFGTRDIEDSH